jgi:hypothetical protein
MAWENPHGPWGRVWLLCSRDGLHSFHWSSGWLNHRSRPWRCLTHFRGGGLMSAVWTYFGLERLKMTPYPSELIMEYCKVSSMIETLQFFPTVPTSYLSRIRACATWIIWNFAFTSVQASWGTSYYARFFQIQSMFWSNLLLVTVEDVEAKGPVTSCNWSTSSHPLLFGRCDSRWQRQPVFHSSRSRNLSQRRRDMDEVQPVTVRKL